jgi:hypothetical protein
MTRMPDTRHFNATPEQKQQAREFMNTLSTQAGYREGTLALGKSSTKQDTWIERPALEVSSWVQIPQLLKMLQADELSKGKIRVTFPEPVSTDPAKVTEIKATQNEIRKFIEGFHSRPAASMLRELAAKIERSPEFQQCMAQPSNALQTGSQWIAAFALDYAKLAGSLQVSTVMKVGANLDPAAKQALDLQTNNAVSAHRKLVYEIDPTQGSASALFEQLKTRVPPLPGDTTVVVGATAHFPGDPKQSKSQEVQEFSIADFLRKEQEKAEVLKKLQDFMAHHGISGVSIPNLEAQDLDAKDRDGIATFRHLEKILNAPKLGCIENKDPNPLKDSPELREEWRAHFIAAAVERLHHPGFATQDRHGTCGAESILRLVNIRNVAEWARLAADLVTEGECRISDRINLRPADDWAANDISQARQSFDALCQSAVIRHAADLDNCDYRNVDDKFIPRNPPHTPKDGGMSEIAARQLIAALLTEESEISRIRDLRREKCTNPAEKLGRVAALLGGIYVSLKWPEHPDYHAVILERYDPIKGEVVFSNPHGQEPAHTDGDRLDSPTRQILNNEIGQQAMDEEDFNRLFVSAILPKARQT